MITIGAPKILIVKFYWSRWYFWQFMYVETVSMSIQTNSEYELSKIPIQHWYNLTIKKSWSKMLLDASWKEECHILENFLVRSIFHRETQIIAKPTCTFLHGGKRRKWKIVKPTLPIFHGFHGRKWNRPENCPVYVALYFKTRLTICRTSLYVKTVTRYK